MVCGFTGLLEGVVVVVGDLLVWIGVLLTLFLLSCFWFVQVVGCLRIWCLYWGGEFVGLRLISDWVVWVGL